MSIPAVDNTTLMKLVPNLDIDDVADPALRLAAFQYIYNQLQAIVTELNIATAIGQIGSIADNTVTDPKLSRDVRIKRIYKVVW